MLPSRPGPRATPVQYGQMLEITPESWDRAGRRRAVKHGPRKRVADARRVLGATGAVPGLALAPILKAHRQDHTPRRRTANATLRTSRARKACVIGSSRGA